MGGSTDTQQLAKLLTRLSLTVRGKEAIFNRKYDCARALSQLKYEAEQGRHSCWHATPKILDVLSSLIGTAQEAEQVERQATSISEIDATWKSSKSNISNKQLPLLSFMIRYIRLIPEMIETHAIRMNQDTSDRSIRIRQASLMTLNIEKSLSRTQEVLYLYYLVQVFDTEQGKRALSLLLKNMRQDSPAVTAELDNLQKMLDVPTTCIPRQNYAEIINKVYETAQRSKGMHDKTIDELFELKTWINFKLAPLLDKSRSILSEQASIIEEMRAIWSSDYSERDIMERIKRLNTLIEEEHESSQRIREELSYYMRTKQVLQDTVSFTKSAQSELMSHHASLFSVAVISYNMFPLLSAFYSVDEFSNYWDVAEDFILPSSSIRKTFSAISMRVFAGIF